MQVTPLNQMRMSDYYFGSERGKTMQFSRKQSGELLGGMDVAEEQLRNYYTQADENFQIVEGIISPIPLIVSHNRAKNSDDELSLEVGGRKNANGLYAYKVEDNGFVRGGSSYGISSSMFWAWIRSLDRCGIVTYFTINWLDTARLLVAMYKNEQKEPEAHDVLQRYTKPHVYLKEHDQFIQDVLYLNDTHKCGIGIKKAEALKAAGYTSLFDIAMSSVSELEQVDGLSKLLAEKLLRALGKEPDE